MSTQNYSLLHPGRYVDRLAVKKRQSMFQLFLSEFPEHTHTQILDVGVTADRSALSSNYFEKYYPNKAKIIALSDQDAPFLEHVYPGLTFRRGDAKALPFKNDSIDIVFSSAVIEHIGSRDHQKKMIAECVRVAKKGVFITTPNRWHPVEVHTLLPLIHWLPKSIHRGILKNIGLTFYSQEENLNLLDRKSLRSICNQLGIRDFFIKSIRSFGFVSNLVLIIKKKRS